MIKLTEKELLSLFQKHTDWQSVNYNYWGDNDYVNWKLSHLPNVLNKSVIDIGANEGFYSFVLESRGAKKVLAIDTESCSSHSCFEKAKNAIRSNIEYKEIDICDVTEEFDIAIYYDVYYHIENPMAAFRSIFNLVKEQMIFCGYVVEPKFCENEDKPLMYLFKPGELGYKDTTNVWGATLPCLKMMIERAGFEITETDRFFDRAIIKANKPNLYR